MKTYQKKFHGDFGIFLSRKFETLILKIGQVELMTRSGVSPLFKGIPNDRDLIDRDPKVGKGS